MTWIFADINKLLSQIVNNIFMCQLSTHFLSIHKKNIPNYSSVTKQLIFHQSTNNIFKDIQVSPNNPFSVNPENKYFKKFMFHQAIYVFSVNPQKKYSMEFKCHQKPHLTSVHKKNIWRNSSLTKQLVFPQSTKNYKWMDDLSYKVDVFPCKRN